MPSEEFYFANSEQHSVSCSSTSDLCSRNYYQVFFIFTRFHLHISTLLKAPVGHGSRVGLRADSHMSQEP